MKSEAPQGSDTHERRNATWRVILEVRDTRACVTPKVETSHGVLHIKIRDTRGSAIHRVRNVIGILHKKSVTPGVVSHTKSEMPNEV